ncbi:RDD family protein [Corallococcus sp. AB011P]|uniref:RDD family protein n=1 Tax=Corallococcus sp. AB011P TaxID=2316735 RepID=UPI001F3746E8|nr:RDD family protein [Corallococcus sp. AB011P]
MSKCLKCGASLPPVGDCPACAANAARPPAVAPLPSLLDRDIHIDRRKAGDRMAQDMGGDPITLNSEPMEPETLRGTPAFAMEPPRGPVTPPGMTPSVRPGMAPMPPAAPTVRAPNPAPAARPAPAPASQADATIRAAAPTARPASPQAGAAAPTARPASPQAGAAAPARADASQADATIRAAAPARAAQPQADASLADAPVRAARPAAPQADRASAPHAEGQAARAPAQQAPRAAAPMPPRATPPAGNAPAGAVQPPRPAAPPPGVAPVAAVPPRAAPTAALSEPGFQNPGVSVPRAAQPAEPRPGSAPTPAYGTEPHIPRPQAASGQPRGNPVQGSPGLPRMDAQAQAASGQPRGNAQGSPGLPRMDAPAQAQASGLPHMDSASQAQASGLPRREPASGPSAAEHWDASQASSGLPLMDAPAQASGPSRRDAAPGLPVMEDPAILPPLETPAFATSPATAPGVSRMEASPAPAPAAPAKSRAPAPSAVPATGEVHARPASLWRRLLSFTVDTAAISAVAAAYITLASSVAGVKGPQPGLTGLDAFVAWLRALHSVLLPGVVLVLVLATVYCAVAAFLWNGRTLGRLLLGLRLVDTHGMAPTPGRAIFRALLAGLSFVLFLGGFWMALFDRRGQTLHDKLTSTFVVQPS